MLAWITSKLPMWVTGKLLGWAVGGILSVVVLTWVKVHFNGIENLNQQLTDTTISLEREKIKLQSLELTLKLKEEFNDEVERIRAESRHRIEMARQEAQKHKDILTDRERIIRLSRAKPDTMQRLGNAATEKRIKQLEDIINSDY